MPNFMSPSTSLNVGEFVAEPEVIARIQAVRAVPVICSAAKDHLPDPGTEIPCKGGKIPCSDV